MQWGGVAVVELPEGADAVQAPYIQFPGEAVVFFLDLGDQADEEAMQVELVGPELVQCPGAGGEVHGAGNGCARDDLGVGWLLARYFRVMLPPRLKPTSAT